jgi:hypothetical protein
MKTLESFTSGGGVLKGGNTASHETYEGAPRPYNRDLMHKPTESDLNPGETGLGGGHHHTGGTGIGSTNAGTHNSNLENKVDPTVDSNLNSRNGVGNSTHGNHTQGNGLNTTTNTTTNTSTETGTKPSIMEKIKRAI